MSSMPPATELRAGAVLTGLFFERLPGDDAVVGLHGTQMVSTAVFLKFADGSVVRFGWAMPDIRRESLTVESALEVDGSLRNPVDESPDWSHLKGCRVLDVWFATEVLEDTTPIWACTVLFDTGRALVVALGELDENGAPFYMPDSLLVMRSESAARAYWPTASLTSAWGR